MKSYVPPESNTTKATLGQVFLTLSEKPKETTERAFKRSYGKKSFAFFDPDAEFNTGVNLITESGERFHLVGRLAVSETGREIEIEDLSQADTVYMESKKALGDGIKYYYISDEDAKYLGENSSLLIIYNENTKKYILAVDSDEPIIVSTRLYNLAQYYS